MTTMVPQRHGVPTKQLQIFFAIFLSWISTCSSYPMIAEVEEEKCFRFNVPEDDDAHMVFVAIPFEMKDNGEEWFVDQVNQLVKNRDQDEGLPKDFGDKPDKDLQSYMTEFVDENEAETGFIIKIQKPRRPILKQHEFEWFKPLVLNYVVESHGGGADGDPGVLGGYSVCFDPVDVDRTAHIIFDVILDSEEIDYESSEENTKVLKKEHLTPLEQNLARSITSSHKVLNEMRYMENREARMRKTADSINSKIRNFSYLSITILLGVTYVQVSYLKQYFKKKKII